MSHDELILNVNSLIKNRRSIFPKFYTDEVIKDEIILQILQNACFAPTHKLTQPWQYVVFRKDGRKKLSQWFGLLYDRRTPPEKFSESKKLEITHKPISSDTIIAIILDAHPNLLPEWEEIAACACAVQNMWLTASAYGLGAYWSSPAFISEMGEFLKLGPNQKCLGFFYLGHKMQDLPASPRVDLMQKIRFEL